MEQYLSVLNTVNVHLKALNYTVTHRTCTEIEKMECVSIELVAIVKQQTYYITKLVDMARNPRKTPSRPRPTYHGSSSHTIGIVKNNDSQVQLPGISPIYKAVPKAERRKRREIKIEERGSGR